MDEFRIAVVGVGATGSVLAAALLSQNLDILLVGRRAAMGEAIKQAGIKVTGELNYQVSVHRFIDRIEGIKSFQPNLIFLATKTFHLPKVVAELKGVVREGTKIVSTHNGLGTEDVIAETFGVDAAFRMSLNYGVSRKAPNAVDVAFFNRPNPLGGLTPENKTLGTKIAGVFTAGGLDTEWVDDIKLHVWKKMVMKCTMASICAVTDRTLKQILDFPPTREIAENCFREVLAVAKAQGYDLGADYLKTALAYLEKAGAHKDSMCTDIEHNTPTEIDFLGGKVVEYARELKIPTPYYNTMTNLVRAMEDSYLHAR